MEKNVSIKNASGLHARPAGMFVKKAAEFKSTVEVIAKGKTVNAKSIMGIMSLGLGQGDELTVVANGEDQEAAVKFARVLRRQRHQALPECARGVYGGVASSTRSHGGPNGVDRNQAAATSCYRECVPSPRRRRPFEFDDNGKNG